MTDPMEKEQKRRTLIAKIKSIDYDGMDYEMLQDIYYHIRFVLDEMDTAEFVEGA